VEVLSGGFAAAIFGLWVINREILSTKCVVGIW
jgi:hypothetical protein